MERTNAITSYVKAMAYGDSIVMERPKRFPVEITATSRDRFPSVLPRVLPACAQRGERRPAPVGILDIRLKGGPMVLVAGQKVELPRGVKKFVTVRALKEIAKAYLGSIVLARRGNQWVRLRDSEAIELPEPGNEIELKSLPSFRLE